MATPFRKVLADFAGGQVDYFSSRDLGDTQYQEVTNVELRIPGKIKRPEGNKNLTGSTPDNYFDVDSLGEGFTLLNSEYSFGEELLTSVSLVNVKGYSASQTGQNSHIFSLGTDLQLELASSLGVIVGDYVEIFRDGASVEEEDNIVGMYKVLVVSGNNIVVYHPNFENTFIPLASNHTMTSNRYKVRTMHQYSANVYGIISSKIGSSTPSDRYYSETRTNPVTDENALIVFPIGGSGAQTYLLEEGTTHHGFFFMPASYFVTNHPDIPEQHCDQLWYPGGNFNDIGISPGQNVTYSSGISTNPDILNDGFSGTVKAIDIWRLLFTSVDSVENTFGAYYGGLLTIAESAFQSAKLEGWEDPGLPSIVTYNLSGAIRVADANFNNTNHSNKWFGMNKGPRYGDTVNYSRSPRSIASRPPMAYSKQSWEMIDQKVPAPTMVKMDGWGDPTYRVKNVGEIGLYVHDSHSFDDVEESYQEHVLYPDAITKDTFSPDDRWATTFIYDGASESELSRDSDGVIGISGFETITPPDVLEEPVTYLDADEDELIAVVEAYRTPGSGTIPLASRKNCIIKLSCLSDGSAGAIKKLNVGDFIKAGSEKMCIISMAAHSGSNTFTEFTVNRGVMGSTPIDLTGLDVYYVDVNQKARAVSVVLNTNGNTQARKDYVVGGETKIYALANKGLGALPNMRLSIYLTWSASGSGNSTIQLARRWVASGGQNYITLQVTITQKDSNTVTLQDTINVMNGDTVVSSNIDVEFDNDDFHNFFTAYIPDGVDPTTVISATGTSTFMFGDTAQSGGGDTDGVTADGLNKRITGFNLYWKPKAEVDWYLVQYYDIEKGWSST